MSLRKTDVLHQPAPHEEYQPPHISIGNTELKITLHWVPLSWSCQDRQGNGQQTCKGQQLIKQTTQTSVENKSLNSKTKIRVYRDVVLTTLLYGSETWVTYRSHIRLRERFQQRCLRTILNIHWSDFIANIEVLEQAEVSSIEAIILKYQLRWAGHV